MKNAFSFRGPRRLALLAAGVALAGGIANAAVNLTTPLNFVPVTPCRVLDTRTATGAFGGPSITGGSSRDFVIPNSACNIPATAQAYSLNVTVVPPGPLGYLTMYPTGQTLPLVSTLNSDGRVKANAAIVPAGNNGAVTIFVTNTTDVVLDIDGYFVPATNTSALAFYPLAPCRVADTRLAAGPLGAPYISGQGTRAFPVLSGSCNVPPTAQAYSLNFTAVPHGPLGYVSVWPAGQTIPLVSTLNASTGAVTANAAIVPAGTNGAFNVFASNDTDLVVDINGYFAPPGPGGLSLYNLQPCRVLDTRLPLGTPPFTGTLNVNIGGGGCAASSAAQAYVLNATVVPAGGLGFLTLWPQGGTQPLASTLNATDGVVSGNMAIVPSSNGSISAYASNATQLVVDILANFAPAAPVSPNAPTITSFSPASGPIGTLVTVTGTNLGTPQITAPQLSGGSIGVPLSTATATAVTFVVPAGEASGNLTITTANGSVTSAVPFTVTPSSTFTITASPASVNLIQGQSAAMAVTLTSANAFNQLAPLSVSGLPAGVTATFVPASFTAGQVSVLTLTAAASQAPVSANISITASATVDALPVKGTAAASLSVVAPTTTLLGRTVVSNATETPLAGVTVTTLGQDGNGNTTGCTGHSTVADGAGNFALTNLPAQCVGPQLMAFDGTTATSPAGKYAGVNLVFTLVAGQVTASPVLVHLPRIDNVETFMVTQNAAANQSYSFTSIPGLSLLVYAGTTFTLPDGTKPDPFPLAAVQVPVDRLPDLKPNVPTMVRVFIVAFQPANTVASQPVAVSYPNVSSTAPGTDMVLMTLDPTHGTMVPYGTGAVSADGTQVVPDADPSHPGHLYGLVHFDWHGQMPPGPNQSNPCPCPASEGDPIDLSSGLHVMTATDLTISGARGAIEVQRIYRGMTTHDGAFGPGNELQYAWQLSSGNPNSQSVIYLVSPDGNQFLFNRQKNGALTNLSIPWLQGAIMATTSSGGTTLHYSNGTVWNFQAFAGVSYLSSITDRTGNVITLTVTPLNATALRISKITDPVGRSLNLIYNSAAHIVSATDPLGRSVTYTYNTTGTLAAVTDPNGGVSQYLYDSQNRLISMIDPRHVTMFQDTFDANGRVEQQVRADGGVMQFAYTLANSLIPTSPVVSTTVTDPLGNQTFYRFNIQGFPTDVTDASGQTRSFTLSSGTNFVTEVSGAATCNICGPPGQGTMSYTYDTVGNMLTSTDAVGNTTVYTYDPVFNQVTSVTDPLNHTKLYTYDVYGNLTVATDEDGNAVKYSYGANGLLLRATDALGNTTLISYDGIANPASVTDALGNSTKIVFDGVSRPLSTTDPLGKTTHISFDVLNRVVSVSDGRGSRTLFTYDSVGNLLSITDPKGNATAFTYDAPGRLQTRTSPLGKTETYVHDLNGNLIKFTDRRAQVSNFTYDLLNRLVGETYQDSAVVTRSYDPYGRLLTVDDSVGGHFTFGYDFNGKLIFQSEPTGSVSYTRDQLQRVAVRQVTGQSPLSYSYDPAGNLIGCSLPGAAISFSYDARNLPSAVARTNGVTSTYTFDPMGRVLSLVHSKGATALNTQSYGYDKSGNRATSASDLSQPLKTQPGTGTVDQANELTSNAGTSYTYDGNGNRLTETTAAGVTAYNWDSRNRLTSITDPNGNTTSFVYDFSRNLIKIDRNSRGILSSQKFVYDSLTNVVSFSNSAGLPVSLLSGRTVDSHFASFDSNGTSYFGLIDPLDSTVAVTDANGTAVSTQSFDPYGISTGVPPADFPFTFTGRIVVAGNIAYFRNRFYDLSLGRFLSEDPIAVAGGDSNFFRYAGDNPATLIDPNGLEAKERVDTAGTVGDDFTNSMKALGPEGLGESLERKVTGPFGWFVKLYDTGSAYRKDGWPGAAGQFAGTASGGLLTGAIGLGIPWLITSSLEATLVVVAAATAFPVTAAVITVAAIVGTAYAADKLSDYVSCRVTGTLKNVGNSTAFR